MRARKEERMGGRKDDGRTDGRMDGQKEGRKDGRTEGRKERGQGRTVTVEERTPRMNYGVEHNGERADVTDGYYWSHGRSHGVMAKWTLVVIMIGDCSGNGAAAAVVMMVVAAAAAMW